MSAVQHKQESVFRTPWEAAAECAKRKWPGRHWKNEEEYKNEVRRFYRLMKEAEFRRHFPNQRHGLVEALRRAQNGNLKYLWAVLSVDAPGFLADPSSWLWERYRKAFFQSDSQYVNTVMQGIASYYRRSQSKKRAAEGREDFLLWLLLNQDGLRSLTAGEILEQWEKKRKELFKQGERELPTFRGDNRELKLRQWLSRQGFKLGQRGKKHRPSSATIYRREQRKHVT